MAINVRAVCAAVIAIRTSLASGLPRAAVRISSSTDFALAWLSPVASTMMVTTPPATLHERIRSGCGRPFSGSRGSPIGGHIGTAPDLGTVFPAVSLYIRGDDQSHGVGRPRSRAVH